MRYLDKVELEQDLTADNALIVGTMMHDAMELGTEKAICKYFMKYPIITDEHETEAMKLELIAPKAKEQLPKGGAFEVAIQTPDFTGYIDYIVPVGKNTYDLYDFKYTSKFDRYRHSSQLHLYKYFFEKAYPRRHIRNLYYFLIPKVGIKQKADEPLEIYRTRLRKECELVGVDVMKVDYDPDKVIKTLLSIKKMLETTKFPAKENEFCFFCEYRGICEKFNKEEKPMFKLPENKRRDISAAPRRTMWIYGAPFSGKNTFANGFPDPLMINTDGNTKYVDAPVIRIRDEVVQEGRITQRTYAWEILKDVISTLELKDNTFKTIVVDLLEDLYEHCRQYMYHEMNITHESDDSFRAWDKVTTEFLTTIRRLMNLDYENIILISHEDTTKDITKRSGDKVTSIKPNIRDKVALKIAGMVDVVARIVSEDDKRTFTFKSDEVVFGGGRLKVDRPEIPLDVDELFDVYKSATEKAAKKTTRKSNPLPDAEEETEETEETDIPYFSEKADKIKDEVEKELKEAAEEETEKPRRRTRRTRTETEE